MGFNESTLLSVRSVLSPTLVAGAISITFPEFSRIITAGAVIDGPIAAANADAVFELIVTAVLNVVTINVHKMALSAVNTWGDAITADINLRRITVLAEGI